MDTPNTFPQRVKCRHCGQTQIESVDANGHIYVLLPGGQFSKGPGGKRKSKGAKLLRANAEQHQEDQEKYPPNMPHDRRRPQEDE